MEEPACLSVYFALIFSPIKNLHAEETSKEDELGTLNFEFSGSVTLGLAHFVGMIYGPKLLAYDDFNCALSRPNAS